jgi:hypothetical protein
MPGYRGFPNRAARVNRYRMETTPVAEEANVTEPASPWMGNRLHCLGGNCVLVQMGAK